MWSVRASRAAVWLSAGDAIKDDDDTVRNKDNIMYGLSAWKKSLWRKRRGYINE